MFYFNTTFFFHTFLVEVSSLTTILALLYTLIPEVSGLAISESMHCVSQFTDLGIYNRVIFGRELYEPLPLQKYTWNIFSDMFYILGADLEDNGGREKDKIHESIFLYLLS